MLTASLREKDGLGGGAPSRGLVAAVLMLL